MLLQDSCIRPIQVRSKVIILNITDNLKRNRFLYSHFSWVFVLLATASKTYIESVLFRTSAYTGAKQANRVPTGSKQDNSPRNDDVKDVSVLLESELIGPV